MIRKALMKDLIPILDIVKSVVEEMQKHSNDQWSASYPDYETFASDVAADELFVDVDDKDRILAFFCLNTIEPPEYGSVPWKIDQQALVIHRLAVNPDYLGRGLATKLMLFAEEQAHIRNLKSLRSDTCVKNTAMNLLFKKMNYDKSGMIRFPDSVNDFICYEKWLG